VHCEPATGIVNPVDQLAEIVKGTGRTLMVDARCTLGGIPISVAESDIALLIGASHTALESVPGIVPVFIQREMLNAKTVSPAQSCSILKSRVTPQPTADGPTHALAALAEALRLLEKEDGVDARQDRYRRNASTLVDGMKRMGFVPLLAAEQQGPILQCFHKPDDADYDDARFVDALRRRNFAIPATDAKYLRIGTIGDIDHRVIAKFLVAVEEAIDELGIRSTAPAAA
jgi:2-aminoethylphosphonate-pyruvate transaminase